MQTLIFALEFDGDTAPLDVVAVTSWAATLGAIEPEIRVVRRPSFQAIIGFD